MLATRLLTMCRGVGSLPVHAHPATGPTVTVTGAGAHNSFDTDSSGTRIKALEASYWPNTTQSGQPTSRLTATLSGGTGNFYTNQPAGNAAAGSSEQLTGELALAAGSYSVSAGVHDSTNDGVRVYLDGQPVLDRWTTLRQAVLGDNPGQFWRLSDPSGSASAANEVTGQPAGTASSVVFGAAGPDSADTASTAATCSPTAAKISTPSSTAIPGAGAVTVQALDQACEHRAVSDDRDQGPQQRGEQRPVRAAPEPVRPPGVLHADGTPRT
jgi:hypothetical protein